MNRSDSTPNSAELLTEAYVRRDDLVQSLLVMGAIPTSTRTLAATRAMTACSALYGERRR